MTFVYSSTSPSDPYVLCRQLDVGHSLTLGVGRRTFHFLCARCDLTITDAYIYGCTHEESLHISFWSYLRIILQSYSIMYLHDFIAIALMIHRRSSGSRSTASIDLARYSHVLVTLSALRGRQAESTKVVHSTA